MELGSTLLKCGSPGNVLLSPATITSTPFDMTLVAKLYLGSSWNVRLSNISKVLVIFCEISSGEVYSGRDLENFIYIVFNQNHARFEL